MKKRKAFDQRGDMAVAAWAEQQHREMTLRARRLSRSKVILEHFFVIVIFMLFISRSDFISTGSRLILRRRGNCLPRKRRHPWNSTAPL
jgi:hypothetical protein